MKDLFENLFGAIAAPLFVLGGIAIMLYMLSTLNVDMEPILSVVLALSPIWLPAVLFFILFEQWMDFVHEKFIYNQGRVTLRIKLPQEVFKSPEAMESILTQTHTTQSQDNLWQTYIDGKHPIPSSFELVSIGGDVRFYANVPRKKVKNSLESQLYAQYPGIEIYEEEIDYASEIQWNPEKWEMMAFHMVKKDDDVIPIKTYIDFGLDKMPKEEEKYDPMSAMLEHLGRVKPYERIFIQFICTPHVKKEFKGGHLTYQSTWEKKAEEKINEIMGRDKSKSGPDDSDNRPMLTQVERDTVASIQRNVGKYAYEVGVRALYIVEAGKFDGDMIGPLLRSFSQYDILNRNSIGIRWRTDFDYNWFSDYSGKRKLAMKKKELEYYKHRRYSPGDKKSKVDAPKIMSVEEIATMYHIPGSTVVTPGVARVESLRRQAPANLPTGN